MRARTWILALAACALITGVAVLARPPGRPGGGAALPVIAPGLAMATNGGGPLIPLTAMGTWRTGFCYKERPTAASDAAHVFPLGKPVPLDVFGNADAPLSLVGAVSLGVQIAAGDSVLWEAGLPALGGRLAPNGHCAHFSLTWNQRDGFGRQVPPGRYVVSLGQPIDAQYVSEEAHDATLTLGVAVAGATRTIGTDPLQSAVLDILATG